MDWGMGVTSLGKTTLKEHTVRFGIKDKDRLKHLCVLGRVGSGRGALLTQMAFQDIERGIGAVILDANGNLAPTLLEQFDVTLSDRLIYIDPSDAEHPYAWNILDDVRKLPPSQQAPRLKQIIESVYEIEKNPLTDALVPHLVNNERSSLITFYQLACDEDARKKFFEKDEKALRALEEVLETYKGVVEALEEKGRYVAKDTLVRNVLGQHDSKFTLSEIIEGKVVVVDLSRMRMFPTRMTPVVRTLVEAAQMVGEERPIPTMLYLHDALRYLGDKEIERAFNGHTAALTVADTVIQESDRERREQALSRCGSIISFAIHPADRALAERAFYPYTDPEEIANLEDKEMVVALTIDAVRTRPFFGTLVPTEHSKNVSYQDLITQSRNKFTTARLAVDALYKKEGEQKGKKGPGGFQDAFRAMFEKRAKGGAPAQSVAAPDTTPPKTETVPVAKETKTETPPPPETKQTLDKRQEVPEETLKNMLYVPISL